MNDSIIINNNEGQHDGDTWFTAFLPMFKNMQIGGLSIQIAPQCQEVCKCVFE